MGCPIGDIIPRKKISIEELTGKTIALDALNTIYQFLSVIRDKTGKPMVNSEGKITSHLIGLFYRTVNLLEDDIKVVYVFDGQPPEFKKKVLQKRRETKEEAKRKYEEYLKKGNFEEARKYAKQYNIVDNWIIESSKELLKYMGVPVVQAPSEGEAQASYMTKNVCFAVGSQDYDCLLYGAKHIVRNLTISKDNLELISLEEVLNKLEITYEKLIWLGIIVGTDFNEKVPGVGIKKALELVKKFDKITSIFAALNYKPDYDYEKIIEFFKNPPHVDVKVQFKKPNREKILEFLVEKNDFSRERVEKYLDKLERHVGFQTSLF